MLVIADLLERLVIEKAGCIFRQVQLSLLDLFSELPIIQIENGSEERL